MFFSQLCRKLYIRSVQITITITYAKGYFSGKKAMYHKLIYNMKIDFVDIQAWLSAQDM